MAKDIAELEENWKATTLDGVLSRFPERETSFSTESRIPIERIYTPEDVEKFLSSRKHVAAPEGFVPKPVKKDELIEKIKSLIG